MCSLYIHLPFCLHKCNYCSFCSRPGRSEMYIPYVEAVKHEMQGLAGANRGGALKSIFIGGGTPTVLPVEMLTELIRCVYAHFPSTGEREFTVEANPGTVDKKYLQALLGAGVNRVSFGVQSFSERELQILGRTHSSRDALLAISAAQEAGFNNLSMDLMYGIPGQSIQSWRHSLQQAFSLGVQHLSLYQLTVEEGTPLHWAISSGIMVLPEEDNIAMMDEITSELCEKAGYVQYEISNYSMPGFECSHNINYWENGAYLACGASAVSYFGGVREKRTEDPDEYIGLIANGRSPVIDIECLPREASFRESTIMGLRMLGGVSKKRLVERYGMSLDEYYGEILTKLIKARFLELTESHLKLTPLGRTFANRVMADLV